MVVVATGRAFVSVPRLAAVRRFISGDRRRVDDLLVARVDIDFREVTAARPRSPVSADTSPRFACVVRTIDAAELRRIDSCVDCVWITRSNCDPDASESLFESWQTVCQLTPGVAAVSCFVETAARALPRAVLPGTLPRRPKIRVDDFRIPRIESERDGAGVLVLI